MGDVHVQVRLEGLEVGPLPPPEELVLDVPEDLLCGAVVDAVPFPRHALGDLGRLLSLRPAGMLAPPAHVAVQDGPGPLRHALEELAEQVGLLRHVGAGRRRPRDYPLAPEVARRREVRLAPGLLELGDVGAHLPPRAVGGEVSPYGVLEGLADDAPVGVVAVVVGLSPYAAPYPHPPHHLEHGLVGDDRAELAAQAHGDLAVAAPVGRAREDLRDRPAQLGPGRPGRVPQRVAIGRPRRPGACEQVPRVVPVRPQRGHRLGPRPGQSPSLSTGARNSFSVGDLRLEPAAALLGLLLAGAPARPGLRAPRPALGLGPERLGAALAAGPAPPFQRRPRHDPELGHRLGLRRPAVDHGRGRGRLLLVCVPRLLAVHGQQRLASERAVYLPPLFHGLARDAKGLGGRPVPMALLEELGRHPPRLDIVLHPEVRAHKKTSHFSMSKKWEAVHGRRWVYIN